MDPFKLPANTAYSYPHRFLPDTYHRGYSFAPILPYEGRNFTLPIPVFDINRYDMMSEVGKRAGGQNKKRKR